MEEFARAAMERSASQCDEDPLSIDSTPSSVRPHNDTCEWLIGQRPAYSGNYLLRLWRQTCSVPRR